MSKLIAVVFFIGLLAGCGTTSENARSSASAKVHTELAGLYYERVQYGIALDEIAQALKADPDYAPAYGVRGLVNMALREDKEAEEDFRKGLRLDKLDSNMHNNYGWFLCQRGREKESIPQFLAALKNPLYGTPGLAYLNAGLCSKKAGDYKDAEEFLQKALVVQPGMPQALLGLAELNFINADYAAARQYFAKLSEKNDNLTAEQLWLGVRIQRKVGDRNSEASYSIQLRKRYPDAKETQMMMRGE
ncbi:MAG: type IV pilus biogenesis/stability protein PilW [Nitrosomonadales bacterium]|nr:type IV pilus biogenesis/stability protein PilW [Nitrosomonadales bacterium]